MAWYYQGSITIEAGSNVVTGTGTQWKVNLYGIGEGQALVIGNERLEILYVDSDTSIRLALPYAQGYTGSYHIETSYAGTGGDASRQISAALRRLTTLTFDWTEWMTSSAATIIATDALGQPVEIATYKALSAVAGDVGPLTDRVQSYDSANGISWKGGQSVVDLVKGYQMQMGLNDGWNNFGVGYIASKKGDTWSILQIPHEAGTRQIASRQWVNTMVEADTNATRVINPGRSMFWGAYTDYLYAKRSDVSYTNLQIDKSDNIITTGFLHTMFAGDYTSFKMWRKGGATEDGGVLFQTAPWDSAVDGKTAFGIVEQTGKFGVSSTNRNAWNFAREGTGRIVATRQWVKEYGISLTNETPPWLGNFNSHSIPSGMSRYTNANTPGRPPTAVGYGSVITTRYDSTILQSIVLPNFGDTYLHINRYNGTKWENVVALTSNMYIVDGNGFYKKSSPIVMVKHNGYATNLESRGAKVSQVATGQYLITGVLGYNSDGAWGVNGGVSIPKDVNGLELVYIKDVIQPDGSITIKTYHRQHSHLPEEFQNKRRKQDDTFYADGEPCNLPANTRIDVRVQMPQDSLYNKAQMRNKRVYALLMIVDAQQSVLLNKTLALPLL